jgi:hypothetical protein
MFKKSQKKLHIVSFDVPFPANYGGVIDVFYKIKYLHEQGVEIYLHCFDYGRGQKEILKKSNLGNCSFYIQTATSYSKMMLNLNKINFP